MKPIDQVGVYNLTSEQNLTFIACNDYLVVDKYISNNC